jgi:uncharacterized membrane protein
MAVTATKRRATAPAKRAGKNASKSVGRTALKHPSARGLALKAFRATGRRVLAQGGERLAQGGERLAHGTALALQQGREVLARQLAGRPPIQVSVDVAVPIAVAWDEWMTFEAFTEGIRRIEDIEREDGRLVGHASGLGGGDWEAEIADEREQEAFAWRSLKGGDCAGLITFHQLSERLTRIELDLDVLPSGPADAVALALPLARRRAETELRQFKARVEFISPDAYEKKDSDGDEDGDAAETDHGGES